MARILIDTGIFVALFDGDDSYHQKAVDFIKNNRSELVTTLANITEVLYLLDNPSTQAKFLRWISLANINIVPIGNRVLVNIGELMMLYQNVPMDFADGCLVYLANELNISQIATIDSDFHIYRFNGKYPFRWVIS